MQSSDGSKKSISSAEPELQHLATFRENYKRADSFCREVQSFVEEAGIPASNELRYAGHHLLMSLDDSGGVANPEDLVRANNHAMRACYEAGEAGILFALDRISAFKTDYRAISVSQVVSNYSTVLMAAETAKSRISASRADGADRTNDHLDFLEIFRTLADHCSALDVSRDELNKVVSKERRDSRRFIITTVIGILAIVAVATFAFWHS